MSGDYLVLLGDVVVPCGHVAPRPDPALSRLLGEAKVVSCNLEGIPSNGWDRRAKAGAWVDQDPGVVALLRSFGVNAFSMANNHVGDYGPEALEAFAATVDGMAFGVGKDPTEAARPKLFELDGARVAMFACSEGEFGVLVGSKARFGANWMGHPAFFSALRRARAVTDYVIVQVHTGVEETDFPLPKARSALRAIVEFGADLVVCHHAHRVQGWERHDGASVFHGIGNAFFPPPMRSPPDLWNRGIALRVGIRDGALDVHPHAITFEGGSWTASPADGWLQTHELPPIDDPIYASRAQELATRLWEERYRSYYRIAMGAPGNLKETIRSVVHLLGDLRGRKRIPRPLMLLHNIRIESHRWAVETFLEGRER